MKHILRNTLLLLFAAVFTLAACNKVELEGLRSEVDSLNSTVDSLKARIDAANVTLSCIPDYEDGSVGVQYTREGLKISGSATLNFAVQPESAAEAIAKDWESSLSVLSFYTLTKADGGDAAEMSVSGASVKDGILTVPVTISTMLSPPALPAGESRPRKNSNHYPPIILIGQHTSE